MPEDSLDLEVDADSGYKGGGEGVVGISERDLRSMLLSITMTTMTYIPEEEASFAYGRVANDEQLEHVIKVLICGILLPCLTLGRRHLKEDERRILNANLVKLLESSRMPGYMTHTQMSVWPEQMSLWREEETLTVVVVSCYQCP